MLKKVFIDELCNEEVAEYIGEILGELGITDISVDYAEKSVTVDTDVDDDEIDDAIYLGGFDCDGIIAL